MVLEETVRSSEIDGELLVTRYLKIPLALLGMMLLLVGLNARWIAEHLGQDEPSETTRPTQKIYTHKVAEGLSMQSGALPGVELIRFDSCRIEKKSNGGFSFGAFNILVIDNLKIAFPEEPVRSTAEIIKDDLAGGASPSSNMLNDEFSKLLSQYPRFSMLKINGLSVDVVDSAVGLKNVLKANKAEAGRGGILKLSGCEVLTEAGDRIQCAKASLSLKPPFLISTDRGVFRIAGIGDVQGLMFAKLNGK
jgi:hypothetical protein